MQPEISTTQRELEHNLGARELQLNSAPSDIVFSKHWPVLSAVYFGKTSTSSSRTGSACSNARKQSLKCSSAAMRACCPFALSASSSSIVAESEVVNHRASSGSARVLIRALDPKHSARTTADRRHGQHLPMPIHETGARAKQQELARLQRTPVGVETDHLVARARRPHQRNAANVRPNEVKTL